MENWLINSENNDRGFLEADNSIERKIFPPNEISVLVLNANFELNDSARTKIQKL